MPIPQETPILDFTINQGSTFTRELTWEDENGDRIDFGNYTAEMHIRPFPGSPDLLVELSSPSDGISLVAGVESTMTISLTSAETAALTPWVAPAYYDIELTDGSGEVTRFLKGRVYFDPEVTV